MLNICPCYDWMSFPRQLQIDCFLLAPWLNYQLEESARKRFGNAIATSVRRFRQKVRGNTNGKKRKRLKGETWIKLAIKPEEIEQTPNDVLAQLTQENSKLRATVEEKAAELYDEMRKRLVHSDCERDMSTPKQTMRTKLCQSIEKTEQ